ncbi:hypothetical protein K435DRAFT_881075 [Dendrothele bispora CBS 962.96]|uniref:F-box domain-containing protein n=1 Tax=Dendrothele bispora (strain CBS 962.96) TaxID=1314807 RepID=A0A4S8KJP5_DENBC|nr:hypothetical protein K435DRAFT_881075 [Dendrothele bispora CBS 962.96]
MPKSTFTLNKYTPSTSPPPNPSPNPSPNPALTPALQVSPSQFRSQPNSNFPTPPFHIVPSKRPGSPLEHSPTKMPKLRVPIRLRLSHHVAHRSSAYPTLPVPGSRGPFPISSFSTAKFSNSTSSSSLPRLPPELTDIIIDSIDPNDLETLRCCTLRNLSTLKRFYAHDSDPRLSRRP